MTLQPPAPFPLADDHPLYLDPQVTIVYSLSDGAIRTQLVRASQVEEWVCMMYKRGAENPVDFKVFQGHLIEVDVQKKTLYEVNPKEVH